MSTSADTLTYNGPDTLSMQIRSLREQRDALRTLTGRYDGHQDANDRAQDLLGEALWHTQFAIMQAQIQFFLINLDEEFREWSPDHRGVAERDELSAGEYRFVLCDGTFNKSYRIEIRALDDVTYSMVKKVFYDFFLDGCDGPNEDGTEWEEGFTSHGFVNIYRA